MKRRGQQQSENKGSRPCRALRAMATTGKMADDQAGMGGDVVRQRGTGAVTVVHDAPSRSSARPRSNSSHAPQHMRAPALR